MVNHRKVYENLKTPQDEASEHGVYNISSSDWYFNRENDENPEGNDMDYGYTMKSYNPLKGYLTLGGL